MKYKLALASGLTMAALALTASPVMFAQGNGTNSQSNETTTKTIQERIAEKKAEIQDKLEANEKERIKNKCVAAQGIIKSNHDVLKTRVAIRLQAYQNIITRLNNLVAMLEAKNIDTAELKSQISTLSSKIDTFNTDLEQYKQALVDLRDLDCVNDPEAFKASLEVSRSARATVVADAADIHQYIFETVKPTLKNIREQLAAMEAVTDEQTNTETQ